MDVKFNAYRGALLFSHFLASWKSGSCILKQHGLKLNGSKTDLLNEFSATHVEMLPGMFWRMKNF